jgi:hypothetical protein
MTCPRCQIEYNALHWGECPHCGLHDGSTLVDQSAMPRLEGVLKTSTILISTDDGGIFGSMDEVPERLRERLVACTSGANAATIFIADQGGRLRLPAALRTEPCTEPPAPVSLFSRSLPSQIRYRGRVPVLLWAGVLVAGFSGALVWMVISQLR